MKREEAIAILKEIVSARFVKLNWVSLVSGSYGYELHVKPVFVDASALEELVKKHDLSLKKENGLLVIFKEDEGYQGL